MPDEPCPVSPIPVAAAPSVLVPAPTPQASAAATRGSGAGAMSDVGVTVRSRSVGRGTRRSGRIVRRARHGCRAASRPAVPSSIFGDSVEVVGRFLIAGRTSTLVTRKPARSRSPTRRPRPSLPGPETLDARSGRPPTISDWFLLEDAQADLLDFVAKRRRAARTRAAWRPLSSRLHPRDELLSMAAGVLESQRATREPPRAPTCRRRSTRRRPGSRSLMSWMPLDDRRRLDAALRVVGHLDRAPAVRLLDRRGHRLGHPSAYMNDLSADVAGRTSRSSG